MRRSPSGFTLIELLIVIGILGVLSAVLLPQLIGSQDAANARSDALQMRTHFEWMQLYKLKLNRLPMEEGHKFVLNTWTSNVVPHTEENFDKYFAPGSRDGDAWYHEKRQGLVAGVDPWPQIKSCQPEDTHYAGRAKEHLRSVGDAGEAMMATDNDGLWIHRDGTVNILLGDGNVRSLSYQLLQERYGLGPFDKDNPVQTWGTNSPIPECKKLAR